MRPLAVVGVLILFALPIPLSSQTSTPKQERLVFQNDFVKVYEVSIAPGEKLPPHESGNRMIYSLTSYTLRYVWGDRSTLERRSTGDIHFHPAGVHAEENAGPTKVSFLIIERSATPLPATEVTGNDMARVSPFNTSVVFDREMAKVFEVKLGPRDAVGMHLGLHRLVYGLTDYDLKITTPDGKEARERGKKGSCRWHSAGLHQVENNTANPARILVFAFKR